MATVQMTRCAGGEHVTLRVAKQDGSVEVIHTLHSDLLVASGADMLDLVKAEIVAADAKTFEDMKAAVEAKVFAEPKAADAGAKL